MAKAEQRSTRRWLRRAVGLGVLAGVAYAVWRAVEANRPATTTTWEPQPFPFPPQPRTDPGASEPGRRSSTGGVPTGSDPSGRSTGAATGVRAIDPVDGTCPASHPVKGKQSSRIYHVPGGQSYDRTLPDRCFVDAAAAEAEGYRAAKR